MEIKQVHYINSIYILSQKLPLGYGIYYVDDIYHGSRVCYLGKKRDIEVNKWECTNEQITES